MNKALKVLVFLPALFFLMVGLRWQIDPAGSADQLGMPLLEGMGRSAQVGDFFSFFVTFGLCTLLALVTGKRTWYYPAAMLMLFAALGRTLAWLFHDAALAEAIVVEVVVGVLLLIAARRLPEAD